MLSSRPATSESGGNGQGRLTDKDLGPPARVGCWQTSTGSYASGFCPWVQEGLEGLRLAHAGVDYSGLLLPLIKWGKALPMYYGM